jgi:hypothetical protein
MSGIRYPYMRREVVSALASLADPDHQLRVWIHQTPGAGYDSLTENIHALFDDSRVLEIPGSGVGDVIYPDEVSSLTSLAAVYDPLITHLGDVSDERYITDPRWPEVVRRAQVALRVMHRNDAEFGTGVPEGET